MLLLLHLHLSLSHTLIFYLPLLFYSLTLSFSLAPLSLTLSSSFVLSSNFSLPSFYPNFFFPPFTLSLSFSHFLLVSFIVFNHFATCWSVFLFSLLNPLFYVSHQPKSTLPQCRLQFKHPPASAFNCFPTDSRDSFAHWLLSSCFPFVN